MTRMSQKISGYELLFTEGRVCLLDTVCQRKSTGFTGLTKPGRLICFTDMLIVTDLKYGYRQSCRHEDILTIDTVEDELGIKKTLLYGLVFTIIDEPAIVVYANSHAFT
eukprot:UN05303